MFAHFKGCVFNRTKRKEQDGFNLQMQQEQEGVKEIDLKWLKLNKYIYVNCILEKIVTQIWTSTLIPLSTHDPFLIFTALGLGRHGLCWSVEPTCLARAF